MNVLITGGSGFVGRYLSRALSRRGDKVVIFDVAPPAVDVGDVSFVKGDILDDEALEAACREHNIDTLVHLAAVVGAAQTMDSLKPVIRVNIEGTAVALDVARRCGCRRFIDLSSEETLGEFQSDPADENHPQRPISPYGITKTAAEAFVNYYYHRHGLSAISLRTSWVYGVGLPRPRLPGPFLEAALAGRSLHYPYGADHRWDFTSIYDLIDGIVLAIDHPAPPSRVYNITSGISVSGHELVAAIKRLIPGADVGLGPGRWQFIPGFEAPQKGAMSVERAQRELGYHPRYPIDLGLKRYLEDLQSGQAL